MAIEQIFLGTVTGDKTGDGAKTAGQKINNNFSYLDAKIDNSSYLISQTGFLLSGQNLTMSIGWYWIIAGINYTNPAAVLINIPYAAAGSQRIDLIVMNQSNTFQRIPGVESISNPVAPPIPKDRLQATLVLVSDNAIGDPLDPIIGSEFVLKRESQEVFVNYPESIIEQINLTDERASLSFIGSNTDVKSIALSAEFLRNGKIFLFKNHSIVPLEIWHNSGSGNLKLLFPNEVNFVIQPKEIIQFSLNLLDAGMPKLEYIGVVSNASITITPYTSFKPLHKGFGNTNVNINEIGDIFCGWSNDGIYRIHEAQYLGGVLTDSNNFKPLIQTEI